MKVDSTQMRIVFFLFNQIFGPLPQKFHPACPQRRSTLHNDLCLNLLEVMLTCAFFKILNDTVHTSVKSFIFKRLFAKMLHRVYKETTFNKIREI